MAIQVVERLENATYAGISDYVVAEMWNASRLHNQKAILEADLGDSGGIERFLTRCLIAIADTALRNPQSARIASRGVRSSASRRVRKECASTRKSRGTPHHQRKNQQKRKKI